jgi:hypothetical protein
MDGEPTAELEAPHPRWTRQRLAALTAAALFVAAVTGVAVAASGAGRQPLPKLPALDTNSSAAANSTTAAPSLAPYLGVQYRVQGTLPALDGAAPAYRVSANFDHAAANRLAAALGLHGTFASAGDSWQLTQGAQTLSISNGPGLPWWFGTNAGFATGAAAAATAVAVPPSSTPRLTTILPPTTELSVSPKTTLVPSIPPTAICGAPTCPPGAECPQVCVPTTVPRPADLPSVADAERIATRTAAAAGFPVAGADVSGHEALLVTVELAPRLGGVPTSGWSWTLDVGSKGAIQDAHGYLSQLAKVGNYPLAGSAVGLARLEQGIGIGPRPLTAEVRPAVAYPVCRPDVHCPVHTITITGVHLTLANALGYLIPAYAFTDPSGTTVGMVPATTDAYLVTPNPVPGVATTAVYPRGVPVPRPPSAPQAPPATSSVYGAAATTTVLGAAQSGPCGAPPPPGTEAPTSCRG